MLIQAIRVSSSIQFSLATNCTNSDQLLTSPGGQISLLIAPAGLDFQYREKVLTIVLQTLSADTEVHHAYGKNRAEKPGKGSMRI